MILISFWLLKSWYHQRTQHVKTMFMVEFYGSHSTYCSYQRNIVCGYCQYFLAAFMMIKMDNDDELICLLIVNEHWKTIDSEFINYSLITEYVACVFWEIIILVEIFVHTCELMNYKVKFCKGKKWWKIRDLNYKYLKFYFYFLFSK